MEPERGSGSKWLGCCTIMDGSVGFVLDWWVVLGVVVCPVVTALIPVVVELLLRLLAVEPP